MTEILVMDANGKIVYRSVEPRLMTEAQVRADLDVWAVDTENRRVMITYM